MVAALGMRIVSPYQKGVIERLGRYQRTAQPGLTLIIPFLDTLRKVDMREQVVDVPPQEVITKDNVVVTVDAIVFYEATDPVKLVYNVANFFDAATKLAQTNLRNVVGEMELDQALTSRETINTKLREVLDDATDKWGVRIVRVEIKRIDPPADVTQAMHRQMKAERESAPTSSKPRASARPRSWRRKASASPPSCGPKARPKPCAVWPKPRGSACRPRPQARARPSPPCSTPSMTPSPTTN